MTKNYWKASGAYAGYSDGNDFYNNRGDHVGIFRGRDLYCRRTGKALAIVMFDDYLAKSFSAAMIGVYYRGVRGGRNYANRPSIGWPDPDM